MDYILSLKESLSCKKELFEKIEIDEFLIANDLLLPDDYSTYWTKVGCTEILDFVVIYPPNRFMKNYNRFTSLQNEFRKSDHDHLFLPEPENFIPWGKTTNGDVLAWDVSRGHCDSRIQVYEHGFVDRQEYEMGMIEFIYKLSCTKFKYKVFPELGEDGI